MPFLETKKQEVILVAWVLVEVTFSWAQSPKGNPVISANPDLLNSTFNDAGPWGSDTILYSINNEVGPLDSPVFLDSVSNELGTGVKVELLKPEFYPEVP
jgi:hypothetical protein